MATDRRTFLKTGTAAVAGMAGLSGCSGNLFGGGSGGPGSAGNWLYDPSILLETQNKFYGSLDYATLYEARQNLPESTQSAFELSEESPIPPEDIDTMTGVGGAVLDQSGGTGSGVGSIALLGSFSAGDLSSAIEGSGEVSQTGEYEGYTLFTSDSLGATGAMAGPTEGSATVALGEGAMIVGFAGSNGGNAPATGRQAVETMIDADAGNAQRLLGNNQYLDQLSDALGSGIAVGGGQIDPALLEQTGTTGGSSSMAQFTEGIRAGGGAVQLNGETTTFTFAGVYEDAETAEGTGIVALVNGMSSRMTQDSEAIESVDASYDGPAVVLKITGNTRTLFAQAAGQVPMGSLGPGMMGPGSQPTPVEQTPQESPPGNDYGTASGDPTVPVRRFYSALSDRNFEEARRYVHPDSPMRGQFDSSSLPEGLTFQVEDLEVVEETESRAVVMATITVTIDGEDQTSSARITLRPSDGEWKLFSS